MISVTHKEDKTFEISWDPDDPHESMFNSWTESDFIDAIEKFLKSLEDNATD